MIGIQCPRMSGCHKPTKSCKVLEARTRLYIVHFIHLRMSNSRINQMCPPAPVSPANFLLATRIMWYATIVLHRC